MGINVFSQTNEADCLLEYNGYDVTLRKNRITTKLYPFIEYFPLANTSDLSYTIPNIYVGLTKIESKYFLNLKIVFDHYNVANYPGFISDKAQIIFHFITGEHLVLLNLNEIKGIRHKLDQLTYKPSYYIPTEDFDIYKYKDIDYVSINWSKESQTYETFQVDVIKNLINCIEDKK